MDTPLNTLVTNSKPVDARHPHRITAVGSAGRYDVERMRAYLAAKSLSADFGCPVARIKTQMVNSTIARNLLFFMFSMFVFSCSCCFGWPVFPSTP
jgi:hypothetical protein